jgi:hypothetical protein
VNGLITKARLFRLLKVDITNGRLFWIRPPKNHSELCGKEAGCERISHSGKSYWIIKVDGRPYRRGHLVYLAQYGRHPKPQLDHKDGNSLNDSISNLRKATVFQNSWNHKRRRKSSPLPMGVKASGKKFIARIAYKYRQIHLGSFNTIDDAHRSYLTARKEMFGEFA